jgi:hypothetical protein
MHFAALLPQSYQDIKKYKAPKVTRKCHPFGKLRTSSEAKPLVLRSELLRRVAKDMVNEKEILHFAALRSE